MVGLMMALESYAGEMAAFSGNEESFRFNIRLHPATGADDIPGDPGVDGI